MKYLNFNNVAYVLLIGIVIFCLYQLQELKRENSFIKANSEFKDEVYTKIIGGFIIGEGRKISSSKFISLNLEKDTIDMHDAIKTNTILIYYNEINCMVCIEEALKNLNKISESNNNLEYQIIAKYTRTKDAILFKKANNISKEIYKPLLKENMQSVFMDDPFIAVVDKNYHIHHVFFLDTESKEKVDKYLELIKYSKYLKSN